MESLAIETTASQAQPTAPFAVPNGVFHTQEQHNEDIAATKIQSLYRGKSSRNDFILRLLKYNKRYTGGAPPVYVSSRLRIRALRTLWIAYWVRRA